MSAHAGGDLELEKSQDAAHTVMQEVALTNNDRSALGHHLAERISLQQPCFEDLESRASCPGNFRSYMSEHGKRLQGPTQTHNQPERRAVRCSGW